MRSGSKTMASSPRASPRGTSPRPGGGSDTAPSRNGSTAQWPVESGGCPRSSSTGSVGLAAGGGSQSSVSSQNVLMYLLLSFCKLRTGYWCSRAIHRVQRRQCDIGVQAKVLGSAETAAINGGESTHDDRILLRQDWWHGEEFAPKVARRPAPVPGDRAARHVRLEKRSRWPHRRRRRLRPCLPCPCPCPFVPWPWPRPPCAAP